MNFRQRLKLAYRALSNQHPREMKPMYYSRVQTLQNLKAATVGTKLEQYQDFIVKAPAFYTYWNFYQLFPEVQTPVDRIARRVASLGGRLYDSENNILEEETRLFHKKYGIKKILHEAIVHDKVFGQIVLAKFDVDHKNRIQNIPSHEITLWNTNKFDITEIRWHWEYKAININEDFIILKNPNLNSKFFGKSPLTSFYSDLNQLHLDRDNFSQFLENNSFFGVAVIPNEDISDDELDVLRNAVDELNKPDSRYKAGVYVNVKEIQQIKQEIQARLTPEEKFAIAVKASNAVGYPYQLLRDTTEGLGKGEQKTVMQNFKEETIDPAQDMASEIINDFILPDDPDFNKYVWKPNRMQIETLADTVIYMSQAVKDGLFSSTEAKVKYLGYTQEEAQKYAEAETENMGKPEVSLEKPEEMKEFESIEPDEIRMEKSLSREKVLELISNQKNINGNDKQRMKKFLVKVENERKDGFAPTEIVIANDRAVMLRDLIMKALEEQVKSLDIIINKKSVNSESTEEDIRNQLIPLALTIDVPLMTYYIHYLMKLGQIDAINQLEKLGVILTPEERKEINEEIQEYANKRVASLLGYDNSDNDDLNSPLLVSSLDDTTVANIYAVLALATTKAKAIEILMSKISQRANLIKESEAARAYNAAMLIVGKKASNRFKIIWEWLRTRAENPRMTHLALVGKTAPIGEPINGEYPGIAYRCQCSLKFKLI